MALNVWVRTTTHDGTRALNSRPFPRFDSRPAQWCRDEEIGPTSVGGRANEVFLFYGTGATPPLEVKTWPNALGLNSNFNPTREALRFRIGFGCACCRAMLIRRGQVLCHPRGLPYGRCAVSCAVEGRHRPD